MICNLLIFVLNVVICRFFCGRFDKKIPYNFEEWTPSKAGLKEWEPSKADLEWWKKSFDDHWNSNYKAYKNNTFVNCCYVDSQKRGNYYYIYVNIHLLKQ